MQKDYGMLSWVEEDKLCASARRKTERRRERTQQNRAMQDGEVVGESPEEDMRATRSDTSKPVVRRKEDERMGEEPMEFSCSSGSPSTMNCRRRSSVTHWNDAVSFSSCNCCPTTTTPSSVHARHLKAQRPEKSPLIHA